MLDIDPRQLTLDDAIVICPPKVKPGDKICHGVPMRKVELSTGKAYKCDQCLTILVEK